MDAMRFESRLAERVAARRDTGRPWKVYASFVGVVFIVLTLTASSMAVPQAVVRIGSQDTVAKYLGGFDGRANVMMLGVSGVDDWICIKVPFKGHLTDLVSISFSEFVTQTGGEGQLGPYVVLRLPEGRSLTSHLAAVPFSDAWNASYFTWQTRNPVADDAWTVVPAGTQTLPASFDTWPAMIGDLDVLSIHIIVGGWDISTPYQCYLGDLSVNGKQVDLANSGRLTGPSKELPPGF